MLHKILNKQFSGLLSIVIMMLPITSIAQQQEQLNVYSARKEALIKPALDKFSEQTGIKVNLITAKADALLKRIESEGKNTYADVFITTDAGRLYRAKQAHVLQPFDSKVVSQVVPSKLRDPEGHWVALSVRARPLFYVKGVILPKQLGTYEDLAKPEFKDKICIRSSNNIYNQSLVASMLAVKTNKETQQWVNDFVKNFARKPKGGDRDQIKAAATGQCDIAIANTYYFAKMIKSNKTDQQQAANAVAIYWPNQKDRGTHINISGAGITKYAKNPQQAKKLIEFLLNKKSQSWYAEVNYEYPVREDVAPSPLLASWGKFKADSINLNQLGKNNAAAVMIMDRAGWK